MIQALSLFLDFVALFLVLFFIWVSVTSVVSKTHRPDRLAHVVIAIGMSWILYRLSGA